MSENQNKKTMISLVTSLVAMVLNLGISFVLSPYIVTNFGEEANGFTQLANNFVNYASLMTIALNSMASRFLTIAYHQNDLPACRRYYSSIIVGNLAILALLVLPATVCVWKLERLLQIQTVEVIQVKLLFALVFVNFFISLFTGVLSVPVYVKNALYIQNVLSMVQTLLRAVGLLLFFTVLTPRIYYVSLVGLILSLVTIPALIVMKKRLLPEVRFRARDFHWRTIWQLMSSGVWNTVNQCGNLLMTGFDLLLSNLFISPVQMGVLSIAKTVPNCILQLAATVNSSFSPNLTIAYASQDQKQILASLRYAMKCSSVLVTVPIAVLCVYGTSFYSLWVPTMDAAELTLLSFLSCMAFVPFAGPQALYGVYTTANKLKLNSVTVVAGGVINFIAVYFLLRHTSLGLIAVAGVSSLISIIRNLAITVPYTARILKLKWYTFYKDVAVSTLCFVISAVVCMLIQKVILPQSWLRMAVSVGIACIISAGLMLLVLLNKQEKKRFASKILRRFFHG